MTSAYPIVPLIEACTPVERPEVPTPGQSYRQIGVQLWGRGAYERETIDGGQTKYATLSRVEADDVIVNKIWARNGSVAVVNDSLAGCYGSGEFPTFAPNRERLEPRWFHWITKTRWFWEQCDEKSRGTSGQNRIRPERFLEVTIPLPPLAEQRRIVARIEELAAKIEEARGLRREAVEESEALVESELKALFNDLAKLHGVQSLGALILDAGYGTSVKCDYDRVEGSVPVLRIPNVAAEKVILEDVKYGLLSDKELQHVLLDEGDVVIVRTNGSLNLVGRCAVVQDLSEPTAFASYLIRLRCKSEVISPAFLQLMLKHLRTDGQLMDFARTTAGQYNVSLGRLRAANIPVPPLPEQSRIVAYLDSLQAKVDALKAVQAETAAELDALLPAVLDKAFKGEL